MLDLRDRECYLLIFHIVFLNVVSCYSHESVFDGKTLYAGKELWKETLTLKSGSRVYKLEGLKSNSWYEVKISYPASIPALFSLQLLKNGVMDLKLNHMRRLLNTEKLIFKTEVNNKDGLYVLVTVEPEGIVAIPNFKERSFIIYNIVCEEQLLGLPYSSWSVVVLVVLCLVVALILPRFLPSYLLIKDGDRDR
ncbi:hypothetical protein V5N11_028744 [Cardamine amara subsp. amara]|uniref:Uncharacterized protein n=1 Tax=Cardamine amara subsp. amara TaxID=228776 RepID=A0ABD1BRD0_CARAN